MARVVVCGGSVIGLATAMMLADDGHEVTVLEGDASPVPEDPHEAWGHWQRHGVPQFHQPHNLFSRARQILDDELPGMVGRLVSHGCRWIDPLADLPPGIVDRTPRADDDRLRFITGRRPVIELAFAQAADEHPGVRVRRGERAVGVRAGSPVLGDSPHIDGVRLDTAEVLDADLVVDAMGRRSKLAGWLVELGATPPSVRSEDSGFVYHSRYFAGSELPATIGPPAAALGTISLLTLAGDNGTWSVTVWAASADASLRGLREASRFTSVVRACPLQAHWLDGEPITDVLSMAGVMDRYRRYVVDGDPVATGVVSVGDAWACTNPSAGRGISVGLLHVQRLREAVREGLEDPVALARRFDESTEADVAPFVTNQLDADRSRLAEMDALVRGADPPPTDPVVDAVGAAVYEDLEVFRGVMETVTCLALPGDVFSRPALMERVAPYLGRRSPTVPGPDRSELLEFMT